MQQGGEEAQFDSQVLYNWYGGKDMVEGLIMDQAKWVTDSLTAYSELLEPT